MAVDSFAKRLSIMNFQLSGIANPVFPSGVIDEAARRDFIWLYRGLLADGEETAGATIRDLIFKGNVLKVKTGKTITVKCYDVLEKLNKEHIPPNEGVYAGTDAGAIIKDILNNSGNSIQSSVNINTGYIVDEVDFTDKSRLDSIKLLIEMVNGSEDAKTFQIYTKSGVVRFDEIPDYTNDEPAITLTDEDVTNISVNEDGNAYYNCCTVVGDGVRAYYPGTVNPNGGAEPDFPDDPRHKQITSNSLKGTADCYNIARGFVIGHRDIPLIISVSFVPNRFDFFSGQLIELDVFKYRAYGKYRLKNIKWSYSLQKSMTFILSAVEIPKLTTYIK